MSNIFNFSLKEYYLWIASITHTKLPWKRKLLNLEFLEYEKKRIKDLSNWRLEFLKVKNGGRVNESYFYTVPIELSSSWKATIEKNGDFIPIGLSALYNDPQVLVVGAIQREMSKLPDDFRLIRIVKSKKINIYNEKENTGEPLLLIEDWEYIRSDKPYIDIPSEKKYIKKIIQENLNTSERLASAFQAPVTSSPYIFGGMGGISLSSTISDPSFSYDLVKSILKMVPPEYRGIRPPELAFNGGKFNHTNGINFHFAERPHFDNNYLSGVLDYSPNSFLEELYKRKKFPGEYSIFSTINPPNGSYTDMWQKLLRNFASSEIIIPHELSSYELEGTDPLRLGNSVNEDTWVQVVKCRQLNPSAGIEEEKLINSTIERLREDFDMRLSDHNKNDTEREILIREILNSERGNVKRLAQSFARCDGKEILESGDFNKARDLIVDNFSDLLSHPDFEGIGEKVIKKRNSERFTILQSILINNPGITSREIYELIKSSDCFTDLYDLQEMLDWLRKKGHVWMDNENKYRWT